MLFRCFSGSTVYKHKCRDLHIETWYKFIKIRWFVRYTACAWLRSSHVIWMTDNSANITDISTSPRSLLFWPKASLMTNNAVNPIVYIYSNLNIQRFLLLKCTPKFIAQRTRIYQEFHNNQARKISTSIAMAKASVQKRFTSTPHFQVDQYNDAYKLFERSPTVHS